MLTSISEAFYQRQSFRLIALFLFLEILFAGLLLPRCEKWIIPYGAQVRILDLSFGFTPDQAYQSLKAYGELGRQRYLLVESLADTVYPLVYTGFFMLLLTVLLKGIFPDNSKYRLLNLCPLLTLVADFSENVGIIAMLVQFPVRLDNVSTWASTAGMIKWTGVAITIGILVIALFSRLLNRIFNKN